MFARFALFLCFITTSSHALQSQKPAEQGPLASVPVPDLVDVKSRAESGDASAQYALARAYETGSGIQKNGQQAALWYRKAAEQGNAKAQNSLGVLYWLGDGVDKDKKEAVEWYRKAARQGDPNAMFNLGAAYYNGEGVAMDDTLALAWFLLSAEGGIPGGQEAAKRSEQEHQPWLLADACLTIAQMYEHGEELPKDTQLATAWYRKAADRGNTQAQINLAVFAMKAKDYDEARRRCEAAAKNGDSGGNGCLGYLYEHGFGVPQDVKTAIKYYQHAAHAGNRPALHALANIYADGNGSKQEHLYLFLSLISLAQKGDKQAAIDAQKLRSSITEKEWKDVQKGLTRMGVNSKEVDEISQPISQPK